MTSDEITAQLYEDRIMKLCEEVCRLFVKLKVSQPTGYVAIKVLEDVVRQGMIRKGYNIRFWNAVADSILLRKNLIDVF